MRFLKNKIARSSETKLNTDPVEAVKQEDTSTSYSSSEKVKIEDYGNKGQQTRRKPPQRGKQNIKSTKTVVKNYGKAISSFAANPIAIPYLTPLADKEGIKIEEFCKYISTAKESIEGIDTFRALLLVKSSDNKKMAAYKRIFQGIAEVFIKYFSVNWIFSGRMSDKETHLQVRFKMLRRIQNPELFTYLK